MNKLYFGILAGIILFLQFSCDKIENPIKPPVELDSTIFPGNWADYPGATWTPNTNTNRNVIIEDYTGHKCPNCPDANTEAGNLETANSGRVFVASIHAGLGGVTDFQKTAPDCGLPSNPYDKYCTEFYNDVSIAYGAEFQSGFGFFGNPMGSVSRITPTGPTSMFTLYGGWSSRVSDLLTTNDLKVNIQSQSNYYAGANGFYLHTEIEFLDELTSSYNTVVYLLENKVVDWQDVNGTADSLYEHHDILRGCIDGLPWGRPISSSADGDKHYFDYSYKLPIGQSNNDYHLLIYVYDISTYEILQVIKQEL